MQPGIILLFNRSAKTNESISGKFIVLKLYFNNKNIFKTTLWMHRTHRCTVNCLKKYSNYLIDYLNIRVLEYWVFCRYPPPEINVAKKYKKSYCITADYYLSLKRPKCTGKIILLVKPLRSHRIKRKIAIAYINKSNYNYF